MRIGVLGNGNVARTLGAALRRAGHEVRLGVRDPRAPVPADHPAVAAGAALASMEEAAAFGEVLVLAINPWTEIEGVLGRIGPERLDGKVLVDLSNDIAFTGHPTLASTEASMGQRVQRWAGGARVVKTLNFVPTSLMVDPVGRGLSPAMMWVAGDDADGKRVVAGLLRDLGWSEIVDLGGIERSRFQEATGLLFTRIVMDLTAAR